MTPFDELYKKLVVDTIFGTGAETFENQDKSHLDCLLYPEKHPVIWKTGDCTCTPEQQEECANSCPFDAISIAGAGGVEINGQCTGCSACVERCPSRLLTASRDVIPVLKAVRNNKGLSYALIAPAFLGQFSKEVTPGKLRTALKKIGFDGVVEVSLFADILTLKESLEFIRNINDSSDFQLTSCCCPIWIAMIRKIYKSLIGHVPGSVSPMIASGRTIKHLYPDALTVFIGPCMAKKAEAREPDIADAIDYVLTFQEVRDIFEALEIDPKEAEESEKDHSSRAGRIYARTGGVSEAVQNTVKRLNPGHPVPVIACQADGVPACKAMVNDIIAGKIKANFYEGMGCRGGCVGGPKSIIDRTEACANVNEYGETATYKTPVENPYVIELLHRLGFDTVESLLEESEIFTRSF